MVSYQFRFHQAAAGIADAWFTMLYVLISFAIVRYSKHEPANGGANGAADVFQARQQHLTQFFNARFVLRIANVDNYRSDFPHFR